MHKYHTIFTYYTVSHTVPFFTVSPTHRGSEVGGVREDQGAITGDASIGYDQGP